ncbi:MAG: phosphatidylglycerol lysyltransferase domain-containing protein, partial [Myxococcota bacterium]|nr:phosphatidylglycerol lysyltransferase domain-containing protein [Myxococcota bacterium]
MAHPVRLEGEETERVLAVLKAWGTHPTSFQILEQGHRYWFDPEVPAPGAVVAYQPSGAFRVAAGVPIAPPEAVAAVAARFIADGQAAGLKTLFFSADDAFLDAMRTLEQGPPMDLVAIGEQPEWDPMRYTTEGPERASLRAQLHRAVNKGVEVRNVSVEEVASAPGPVRAEVESVLQQWLASRR